MSVSVVEGYMIWFSIVFLILSFDTQQAATSLSELDQSLPKAVLESMQPLLNAIVKPELLKHQDKEVKLVVATCICEITRVMAPEAPYSDDVLKVFFAFEEQTINRVGGFAVA